MVKRSEVSKYYPYLNLVPRSHRATETAWPWKVWVRDQCWIETDNCNTYKTERREGMSQPQTPKLIDHVSALGFELFSDVNFSFVPINLHSWRSRE